MARLSCSRRPISVLLPSSTLPAVMKRTTLLSTTSSLLSVSRIPPSIYCPVPLVPCRKPDENRRHAALRILSRCPTCFRFAPCLTPISQVFQPVYVVMQVLNPDFSNMQTSTRNQRNRTLGQGCFSLGL